MNIGINQRPALLSPAGRRMSSLASGRFSPTSIKSGIISPGRRNKSRRTTLSTRDATSSSSFSSSSPSPSSPPLDPSSLLAVAVRAASPAEENSSLQRTKVFAPLARPDDAQWLAPPLCLVRSQIEVVAFTKEAIQALDKPSFSRGGRLRRILAKKNTSLASAAAGVHTCRLSREDVGPSRSPNQSRFYTKPSETSSATTFATASACPLISQNR
mmetsp:Transcript_28215/g.81607  ORF Transcript_28215/g.81607 Transcript_28215/m.81607 type:complete len:214 (-) Transcript_28215:540-1181(-)